MKLSRWSCGYQPSSWRMSRSCTFMQNISRVKDLSIFQEWWGKKQKNTVVVCVSVCLCASQCLSVSLPHLPLHPPPFSFPFFRELGWCYTLQLTLLAKMRNCTTKDHFHRKRGRGLLRKCVLSSRASLGLCLSSFLRPDVVHLRLLLSCAVLGSLESQVFCVTVLRGPFASVSYYLYCSSNNAILSLVTELESSVLKREDLRSELKLQLPVHWRPSWSNF